MTSRNKKNESAPGAEHKEITKPPLALPPKRWKWFKRLLALCVLGGVAGVIAVAGVLLYFAKQVPDYRALADYQPKQITRIYAHNGDVMAEYAEEKRVYLPIGDIPQPVIQAFLAAEDTDFYNHPGFDVRGIIRAILVNTFTNRKQGASTITQQVAKTFLLSSERTYTRKIKELILAYRMERAFTKNQILELYLNQIYLGNGTYGVAAAALGYFGKPLEQLSIGQRAMLAGLPKAPSAYNPLRNPRVARLRRDVIIRRMEAEGVITSAEADAAIASDLELDPAGIGATRMAGFFSEHIRRELEEAYGEARLYQDGLQVQTTLDPQLQAYAEEAVYSGLRDYDRRHGYRGPLGRLPILLNWQARIDREAADYADLAPFGEPAVVLELNTETQQAEIGLSGGRTAVLPLAGATWARAYETVDKRGPKITDIVQVLAKGDIIFVRPAAQTPELAEQQNLPENAYGLEQIPEVEGALVAIDVRTGAVRALVGGLRDGKGFNRAIQGKRQVGSAFKTLVYAQALEEGFTPASIILDAPVVLRHGEMNEAYKPQNYSRRIYGETTLRVGLEKSRNLMTIRLARELGIGNIIHFAQRFGLTEDMQRDLSTALGSSSFSLLDITSAYSVFANRGLRAEPYFIERISSPAGGVLQQRYPFCNGCSGAEVAATFVPMPAKAIADNLPQNRVVDAVTAYQTADLLQGVIKRGTGWRARAVGRDVAAKTGTTNDYVDAWFIGFSPDLAVGVWVGFDTPRTLGDGEAGSKAAGPIWSDFMQAALAGKPNRSFTVPGGVSFVRIDADTGTLPTARTQNTLLEVFRIGTEPGADLPQGGGTNDGRNAPNRNAPLELEGIY